MRHAFGFVLGVLLTPALLYGAAWGYVQAGRSFDGTGQEITDRTRIYGAFALLAAVGLVMGVIIVARWASPLVSLVPALALLGLSGYFLVDPGAVLDLPGRVPPAGDLDAGLRMLLGSGLYAMMGLALLMPSWAPRRWSSERDDDAADIDFYQSMERGGRVR
ncbi:hypothetical protein SAMN05443665_102263 [Actinomadura meyerae]|uniref:Tryptophan-associated transmembrane protein (Trp_oprn_chp) n=1 Tax=Actinomadura meyerae TaxID=240840 RepID=A0A239LHC5_9ACTN|nr:hypothetical protein [Actinomadura meyerae]SNT28954.1 hypothetical protein SAMN05443665_102263 [Actinomadura meyerae]